MTEFTERAAAFLKVFVSEIGQVSRDRKAAEIEDVIRIKPRILKACQRKYPKTELLFENWEKAARKTYKITSAQIRDKNKQPRKYADKPPAKDEPSPADGDADEPSAPKKKESTVNDNSED